MKLITLCFSLLFGIQLIYSQDGALDLTFGDGGVVIIDSEINQNGQAITMQEDGKILIAGYSDVDEIVLVRLMPDGTLDSSFNYDGILIPTNYDFGNCGTGPGFINLIMQEDGKILVGGSIWHENNYGVRGLFRINSNGFIDPSFGIFGEPEPLDVGIDGVELCPRDFILLPDNKILVMSNFGDYGFNHPLLIKYNSDGTLDETFNGSGYILEGEEEKATAVAVQSDGKIVFACGSTKMFRYNSNATKDSTFSEDGELFLNFGTFDQEVIIQPDQKILFGFNWGAYYIYRYNEYGHKDVSFSDDGISYGHANTDLRFHPLALAPDGKIIQAGYRCDDEYIDCWPLVCRLNSKGELDYSFGDEGIVETKFNDDAKFSAVTIQEDGKIVCTGYINKYVGGGLYNQDLIVVRYNSSLETEIKQTENNINEIKILPNPVTSSTKLLINCTKAGIMDVKLYDITGRLIKTFMTGANIVQGINEYSLELNIASGIYILNVGDSNYSQNLLLEKL